MSTANCTPIKILGGKHPCLSCGACCCHFRVSFHWSETLPESHHVPEDLTLPVTPHLLAMKGTGAFPPRCVALEGTVGQAVRCVIYERRPSPCRNFKPSYEDGIKEERCDQARMAMGLKPLEPSSWHDDDDSTPDPSNNSPDSAPPVAS